MLVKGFWKAALVLAVVMMLASAALAASSNSGLVGGKEPDGEDSLERELEGGIKVVLEKVFLWNSGYQNCILVMYNITSSEEDITLKIQPLTLYDNQGNEFDNLYTTWIGNKEGKERAIIAGVPTTVEITYKCGDKYKIAPVYPRVGLVVNGKTVTFKNVPGGE